ncbi:MAG: beta-class carbonic anhydrase [Bacillota bacterium]
MSLLNDILLFNNKFVSEKMYEPYITTKFPDKRLVILTCMDTRLVELVTKSINMKNGDVKIVRNAGAVVSHPFGSIMKSLLLAVYKLQADEVFVIGHYDCGMAGLNAADVKKSMIERGISEDSFETLKYAGINWEEWLTGFSTVEESVARSVETIRNHPLMHKEIPVHGLVIDPSTGKLDLVSSGYKRLEE